MALLQQSLLKRLDAYFVSSEFHYINTIVYHTYNIGFMIIHNHKILRITLNI